MVRVGGAAKEVRRAGAHFFVEALDASSDDEAELDGVGDECGNTKVSLLECDYVCWFGRGLFWLYTYRG